MQTILGEVGGITEQAHIKLLRTLTSEGPDLQKGSASVAARPARRPYHRLIHSLTISG